MLGLVIRFPDETAIIVVLCGMSVVGLILYIWELTLIGWVVDFLDSIGMPKPKDLPLEYEQMGEMVVVILRDNVGTALQCQSVQKQLKLLPAMPLTVVSLLIS